MLTNTIETNLARVEFIKVTYQRPDSRETTEIRFNMAKPENQNRFVRLLIWGVRSNVPLTISTY